MHLPPPLVFILSYFILGQVKLRLGLRLPRSVRIGSAGLEKKTHPLFSKNNNKKGEGRYECSLIQTRDCTAFLLSKVSQIRGKIVVHINVQNFAKISNLTNTSIIKRFESK